MEAAILVVIMIAGFTYSAIKTKESWKNRCKRTLKEKYGKEPEKKEFKRELIRNYLDTVGGTQQVDEVTWNDLNMDDVYQRINNCDSTMGEEILYAKLHYAKQTKEEEELLEKRIAFCEADDEKRYHLEETLSKLGKRDEAYYIPSFIQTVEDFAISNLWVYQMLRILLVVVVVAAVVFHNIYALSALVVVFLVNLSVYIFTVRLKFDQEIHMMGTAAYLITVARELEQEYQKDKICEELAPLLPVFAKMDKKAFLLNIQSRNAMGDVFEMLQDFLLGVTQWHILTYMKVLNQFMDNQDAYLKIYRVVGELDAAVSTGSFRKSLPLVTVPEYEEAKQLEMEEIYHPLLHGAVTNSMELQHNCIITGSNASGKSTFIKTIAVNVILAQSIHTCTAKRMHLPHAKMITSMAVRDDILSGDSYFIKEIKYLKRILDALSEDELVICVIDEILRGTNTQERIAASKAIMEYLAHHNCIAIVASHDKELTELEKIGYDNYHFSEEFGEEDIVFDYKLQKGPANSQNAIRLLSFTGFPETIIERAENIRSEYR
ncbi:MAG: MutS-related protein [Roseburia sp.]